MCTKSILKTKDYSVLALIKEKEKWEKKFTYKATTFRI